MGRRAGARARQKLLVLFLILFFLFFENKGFVISLKLLSWQREGEAEVGVSGVKGYGRDQLAPQISYLRRGLVKGEGCGM